MVKEISITFGSSEQEQKRDKWLIILADTHSGCFQHEIHMHGGERKNDAAIVCLLQKTRV
jgi:hypothetical protein